MRHLVLWAIISLAREDSCLLEYDCGGGSTNMTTLSLLDVGECNVPSQASNATEVYIQLLQLAEYDRVHVHQCRIEIDRTIYYCMNGLAHISCAERTPSVSKWHNNWGMQGRFQHWQLSDNAGLTDVRFKDECNRISLCDFKWLDNRRWEVLRDAIRRPLRNLGQRNGTSASAYQYKRVLCNGEP